MADVFMFEMLLDQSGWPRHLGRRCQISATSLSPPPVLFLALSPLYSCLFIKSHISERFGAFAEFYCFALLSYLFRCPNRALHQTSKPLPWTLYESSCAMAQFFDIRRPLHWFSDLGYNSLTFFFSKCI